MVVAVGLAAVVSVGRVGGGIVGRISRRGQTEVWSVVAGRVVVGVVRVVVSRLNGLTGHSGARALDSEGLVGLSRGGGGTAGLWGRGGGIRYWGRL